MDEAWGLNLMYNNSNNVHQTLEDIRRSASTPHCSYQQSRQHHLLHPARGEVVGNHIGAWLRYRRNTKKNRLSLRNSHVNWLPAFEPTIPSSTSRAGVPDTCSQVNKTGVRHCHWCTTKSPPSRSRPTRKGCDRYLECPSGRPLEGRFLTYNDGNLQWIVRYDCLLYHEKHSSRRKRLTLVSRTRSERNIACRITRNQLRETLSSAYPLSSSKQNAHDYIVGINLWPKPRLPWKSIVYASREHLSMGLQISAGQDR